MSNPGAVAQPQPSSGGWGTAKPDKQVELPSGHTATVREMDIVKMVELDILDKIDGFSGKALQEPGKKGKKGKGDVAEQAKQLKDLMVVLDKVVVASTIDPVVHPQPADGEELIADGRAYVHLIGVGDKMMIFNTAIEGMTDFFRLGGQQAADVGALEAKQSSGEDSE